jgi:hypothetical protein
MSLQHFEPLSEKLFFYSLLNLRQAVDDLEDGTVGQSGSEARQGFVRDSLLKTEIGNDSNNFHLELSNEPK